MSGRESVHGAVPVSAALAKPVVVAVPVHRVTDPRAKCMPEQSRFAEHLARRPCFPGGSSANWTLKAAARRAGPTSYLRVIREQRPAARHPGSPDLRAWL